MKGIGPKDGEYTAANTMIRCAFSDYDHVLRVGCNRQRTVNEYRYRGDVPLIVAVNEDQGRRC